MSPISSATNLSPLANGPKAPAAPPARPLDLRLPSTFAADSLSLSNGPSAAVARRSRPDRVRRRPGTAKAGARGDSDAAPQAVWMYIRIASASSSIRPSR